LSRQQDLVAAPIFLRGEKKAEILRRTNFFFPKVFSELFVTDTLNLVFVFVLHARAICNKKEVKFSIAHQCYDHYFWRFLPIFGEKIGVLFTYNSYNQFLCINTLLRVTNAIFSANFSSKMFLNHNFCPRTSRGISNTA
jgi:hypothetical protein